MANPITWDDVVALASEMTDVETDAQNLILDYVNSTLNESMFLPAALKLARIYLAAHLGTTPLSGGGSTVTGPVLSEEVGGIKRTYADVSAAIASGSLSDTTYGVTYQFLVRTSRARLPLVI